MPVETYKLRSVHWFGINSYELALPIDIYSLQDRAHWFDIDCYELQIDIDIDSRRVGG